MADLSCVVCCAAEEGGPALVPGRPPPPPPLPRPVVRGHPRGRGLWRDSVHPPVGQLWPYSVEVGGMGAAHLTSSLSPFTSNLYFVPNILALLCAFALPSGKGRNHGNSHPNDAGNSDKNKTD